ncbi:hypothetical protein EYR40_004792 [Pleurotus pulmonarius]|nr:hypothetical protein EYR36_006829 [Pleurotus pulmonarius]KAF4601522.1 hypothetical protein EYR38_006176 [Pleurotus pulmonarius]KAF4601594.1 hypothetical protein EYR40_004792 [Pleurotus pulmonarius]
MYQSLIFNYFPLLSGHAGPRSPRPLRIHHLPLELLQLIFQQVVVDFEDEEDEYRSPTFGMAHSLSLVCKSWRNLVLNNPVLWAVIDAQHPEHVLELSLLRSMHAPLILNLEPDQSTTTNASWMVYREFHRFASFSSRPRMRDWHILQGQLCSSAPLLQSFDLSMGPISASYFLPDNIFGGVHPPRLRKLHLQGFQLNWSHHSFLFYNITNLSLAAENRPSYTVFIEILQTMPSLQKLTLAHSLPSDVQFKPRLDVVSLPCLEKFVCEDTLIPCLAFLRYVKASLVSMELKLSATSLGKRGGSEALFQACSKRIRPVAPDAPSDPFEIKLYDLYNSDRVCKVLGYLPLLGNRWGEVHIEILIYAGQEENTVALEQCVTGVMKHLPLGHVKELFFNVPPYLTLSYAFWMEVFPDAFPGLSRLVLANRVVHSLFAALEMFFKTEQGLDGGCKRNVDVPFPSVREISCDFSDGFSPSVKCVLESCRKAGLWFDLVHKFFDFLDY